MLINKFAKKFPQDPINRRMIEIEVNGFMSNDTVTKDNMKALEAKINRKINPPSGKLNVENRRRMRELATNSPDFNYNEVSIGSIGMNNTSPTKAEAGKKQFPGKKGERQGVNAQIRCLAQREKSSMLRHNSALHMEPKGANILSQSTELLLPPPNGHAALSTSVRASIDEVMQRRHRGHHTSGTVPIKISTRASLDSTRLKKTNQQAIYENTKE